jgi:membrane associated rhomboid family serine protease
MGISSRDYVREPTGRGHGLRGDTPACKWLILVTCVVFLLQFVTNIDDWFALAPDDLRSGQLWRFVTYAFVHDRSSLLHILFNMLGLWWFGAEIERLYGSREFTLFYLVAAAAAGAGFVVFQTALGFPEPVVGASGGVLAVLTLFAAHYPRERIYVYGLIPIEVRWVIVFFAAMDLWPVLLALSGERPTSHIAHAAHLLGILFGWMYRRYHWHLTGWLDRLSVRRWPRRWRQTRTQKKLKVFDPEPEPDLDAEVDRILAKIHEHGSGSLTEREQSILTRASQQYKNRR